MSRDIFQSNGATGLWGHQQKTQKEGENKMLGVDLSQHSAHNSGEEGKQSYINI